MKLHELMPRKLILGDPITVHGLGIIPIIADAAPDAPPLNLLEQALDGGSFKLTELSEGGRVPFLRADNCGTKPVLILDGEELVGGKQNRIVNTTIIVLAGSTVDIPVSCAESGRWRRRRDDFSSGEAVFRAKSRMVQKASVTFSLRQDSTFYSDQNAVWNEVNSSLAEMKAPSATADFQAGRAKVAHQMDSITEKAHVVDRQVGAIFFSTRGVLGLEFLATPELFALSLRKIVRCFAFEVLSDDHLDAVQKELMVTWWEKVLEAPLSRYSSPGAGEDFRVAMADLIGSGLLWNENVIHFSCFPREAETNQLNRMSLGERRRRRSEQQS